MLKRVLILIVAVVVLFQGYFVADMVGKFNEIGIGQSREKIHASLGSPSNEWSKASTLDTWRTDFLAGGLSITVNYEGADCSYEKQSSSYQLCSVRRAKTQFHIIWSNSSKWSKEIT